MIQVVINHEIASISTVLHQELHAISPRLELQDCSDIITPDSAQPIKGIPDQGVSP